MTVAFRPLLWIAAAAVLVLLALGSVSVVPQTREGVLLRMGEPVAVINRSGTGGGPVLHWPLIDRVQLFDRRPRALPLPKQEMAAADGSHYAADAFARVTVVDPVALARAGRDEAQAADALAPAIVTALGDAVAARPPQALLGSGEGAMLAAARAEAEPAARRLGLSIRDLAVEGVSLPAGPVLDDAIARMHAARHQQALDILTAGVRDADSIRQKGDADAAAIYASSYGQDHQFFAFYRSLKSYRKSLSSGTVVLGPDSAYLQAFRGR